jgi:LytS/YehU family sensor histidine kinase
VRCRLAQARLQLLQAQLHPHFLFNTLHAISELVHEAPETADRMITSLSDLLREALRATDIQEVPLRRELELLERYLEIQHARFGDRLHVEIDVDRNATDALVPHLILQPLVENAIRHGIGARAAHGRIRVAAARKDDTLKVVIEDDGRGIEQSDREVGTGVGLGNTRERLQSLYGAKGHLTIRSRPEGGTSLSLILPWRPAPEVHQ